MQRQWMVRTACVIFAGVLTSQVNAAVINVGSASVPQGTASVVIPVTISGGETITSATIAFGVGDGGPAFGGTDVVPITAVNRPANSIFVDAGSPSLSMSPELPSSSATSIGIGFAVQNYTTTADGLIVNVTLSTAALLQGQTYNLVGNIGGFSEVSNGLDLVPFAVNNGTLTITSVPEPAALALMGGAGMFLIRRRRA